MTKKEKRLLLVITLLISFITSLIGAISWLAVDKIRGIDASFVELKYDIENNRMKIERTLILTKQLDVSTKKKK